jgi:GH24 family phage-related lysozyme (muramidase)
MIQEADFYNYTKAWILNWEGYKTKVYSDSRGIPTIGVGFNLQAPGASQAIINLGYCYDEILNGTQELTSHAVEILLDASLKDAIKFCNNFHIGYENMPINQKIITTDLMFNMGPRKLGEFVRMLNALENQNWKEAAVELKNSKYYYETGNRAKANAKVLSGASEPEEFVEITRRS